MKRSEIKSSLRSQVQDGNKQEDATEPQTAGFKSQVPKEDKVSGDRRPVSQPDYSPQSLKVQVDAHSKDSKEDQSRQESPDGQLNEINKLPSAKSCERNQRPDTQQRKTGLFSEGGVKGTGTLHFYSLRSQTLKPNESKGSVNRTVEARHHPFNPKPDQTAGLKGEDERMRPNLTSSSMKRHRHERGPSEEMEKRVNDAEMISSSPTKRGRRKSRPEANSER